MRCNVLYWIGLQLNAMQLTCNIQILLELKCVENVKGLLRLVSIAQLKCVLLRKKLIRGLAQPGKVGDQGERGLIQYWICCSPPSGFLAFGFIVFLAASLIPICYNY